MIKKATWHYLLDVALGLLSLLLTVSTVFLWVVFPRGFYGARQFWVDVHKWGGLALGIGVLIHVLLHWKWMLRMTRRTLGFGPRKGQGDRDRDRERAKCQRAVAGRERVKRSPMDDGRCRTLGMVQNSGKLD